MFGPSSTPFGGGGGGFGTTNTAPTFGAPVPAPFGAPPAFGGGGFGAPAPAPSSGFGGFGAPAPSTGFGGFGAPAPAPSAFGSTGGFGSVSNSSPFGVPAPAPGGSIFGAPAPPPGGGLFGAPSVGGFGAPAPSSGFGGFGAAPSTQGFGASTSTFGAPNPAPTPGLFGNPTPAPGGFGSTGGFGVTSTFGSPTPAPVGGLFGAPAPVGGGMFGAPAAGAPGQGGTKAIPFQVTQRQDGAANITLHSITAMPQYENKSFEECRFEDYSQGNRGSGSGNTGGGFGTFGAPAPPTSSAGLFGAVAPPPAFGAPATSTGGFGGFGAPSPAPSAFGGFGAPATSTFGAPATSTFGTPALGTSSFGAFGTKPPAPGGLFGSPAVAPGGLFGAPAAPPPGGGLFGAPAATGAFGAPAPPTGGGLFSSTPSTGGGLFGSPTPAPSFSGFGALPSSGGFGGFGAPAPTTSPGGFGGFGAPATAFGPPPAGGGLFGSPPPAGSGLFGAKPTAGFGAPMPAPAPNYYGMPTTSPSLFGAPTAVPQMPPTPPVGTVIPPATNEILAQQMNALEAQRKDLEKMEVWRDKSSESSAIVPFSQPERDSWNHGALVRSSYSPYRTSPKSNAKIRPRGFLSPEPSVTPSMSRLGSNRPVLTPDVVAASAVTRLVIKPNARPKMKLFLDNRPAEEFKSPEPAPQILNGSAGRVPPSNERMQSPAATNSDRDLNSSTLQSPTPISANGAGSYGYQYYQRVINSPDEAAGKNLAKPVSAPKLTKPGYRCTPSIQVLQDLSGEDLAAVTGFCIERVGFGKVEWEGAVDVRGADLDRIAVIEERAASMYMLDEEEDCKPPVGSKLNRPAILTWYNIFPKEGGADADEETKNRFAKRVEKQTGKMGAELISLIPSKGIWKIRVQHFSRYGLGDEESDDDEEMEKETRPEVHFESGERGGRSRASPDRALVKRKATPHKVRWMEEETFQMDEDEMALVSDAEVTDEYKAIEEAEMAYTNLYEALNTRLQFVEQPTAVADFSDEGEESASLMTTPRSFVPNKEDLRMAAKSPGICARIAAEAGTKTSSIDYGIRMGRSFRVGWGANGTFVSFGMAGELIRRRPVFSDDPSTKTLDLLKIHHSHSEKNGQFFLPSGSPSHDSSIHKTLKMYAAGAIGSEMMEDGASVAKQAFSLLSCFCVDKETVDLALSGVAGDLMESECEERRTCAISQWLVDSCSMEVDRELKAAKQRQDNYGAILSAVSGGDIEKACNVAVDMGFGQLAAMLSSGPEGRTGILKEVLQWTDKSVSSKIPEQLVRIYFLLGGDQKMEEDIYRKGYSHFDWRRRLAMRLTYDSSGMPPTVANVIDKYEASLAAGVAPYPQAQYLPARSRDENQCVLYRLLRLGKNSLEISLSELINPLGYTSFVHDFSLSFHLAASVSAMGCSSPLSPINEQQCIDGYMAQLVNEGYWEWAVYVSLCAFKASPTEPEDWKILRAKRLILQNFHDDDPSSTARRRFLEGMRLPSDWFEEALALRCATSGDEYGYIKHMAAYSTQEARLTLECILIPNILFLSKAKVKEALTLVEIFACEENTLSTAVFDFFQVYQNILMLDGSSREEIEAAMPALVETCNSVEQILSAHRTGEEKLQGPTLGIIPATKRVPMEFFLAESLAQISLFRLQLKALESGFPISNISSQIFKQTTWDHFGGQGIATRDNLMRWCN
jgi:nuclear pore complex protein Nup98-Nup96